MSEKITPFLWFDQNAEEAIKFYAKILKIKIKKITKYSEEPSKAARMPKGSVMTVAFTMENQDFVAINGGPVFKFTPAISLTINCKTVKEVERVFNKLSAGGQVLMPLDTYPFSKKYAWVNDKYGLSWQINCAERKQKITPFLMFINNGKAEEAMKYYISIFKNAKIKEIHRAPKGGPAPEGKIMHAVFTIAGQEFMAADSYQSHNFSFTPAISFVVNCKDQKEIDFYWNKLTKEGKEVQCGWLTDKYGVSWQVTPQNIDKLLTGKGAWQAMIGMKKIVIKDLKK